jgi:hypothetical protein
MNLAASLRKSSSDSAVQTFSRVAWVLLPGPDLDSSVHEQDSVNGSFCDWLRFFAIPLSRLTLLVPTGDVPSPLAGWYLCIVGSSFVLYFTTLVGVRNFIGYLV